MAKTRAEIQKAYRDRKRAGRCIIRPRVEVDKGEIADELAERGLLGDWNSESARAITLAVQIELRKLLGSS